MTTQQRDLAGLKALVTGATSGLGRVIALQLARDGADVIVHGRDAATRGACRHRNDRHRVCAGFDPCRVSRDSESAHRLQLECHGDAGTSLAVFRALGCGLSVAISALWSCGAPRVHRREDAGE